MSDWRDDPAVRREMAEDRLYVDMSEHLALAIERRGLTRSELARECGVSKSAMTQRLRSASNLTLKVIADTLHALGYGLEVGLVDRRDGNRVERLRDYEAEYRHEHDDRIIHLDAVRAWGAPTVRDAGATPRAWAHA